jgi:hypothetical protein
MKASKASDFSSEKMMGEIYVQIGLNYLITRAKQKSPPLVNTK